MSDLIRVVEIGSGPRFNWVVGRKSKAFLGDGQLRERCMKGFYETCETLDVDPSESWEPHYTSPQDLMRRDRTLNADEKHQLDTFAGYLSMRVLVGIGLDEVYNWEQTRREMSEAALEHIEGFEPVDRAVSWGSDTGWPSYKLFECVGEPRIEEPYHQDERRFVLEAARKLGTKVKVIETGAVPLAIWNSDHFYYSQAMEHHVAGKQAEYTARENLIQALDENAIIPVMRAHLEGGVYRLTIDLSRVSQHPEQMPLVLDSIARMNDGAGGMFGIHFCFDDYGVIASSRTSDRQRRLGDMENVDVLYIESANKDDGRRRDMTVYGEHIRTLRENGYRGDIAPGFVNVHTDNLEPVDLIGRRIRAAIEADGEPGKIVANPDCGLRTRKFDVAVSKLRNLHEAAQHVQAEY